MRLQKKEKCTVPALLKKRHQEPIINPFGEDEIRRPRQPLLVRIEALAVYVRQEPGSSGPAQSSTIVGGRA